MRVLTAALAAAYQRTAGGYGDITQDDFGPEDYSMGWILDD